MEERTFDLTVPVTRLFRVIWIVIGVGWIICGFVNIGGNAFLGAVQLVLGLGFLFFSFHLHRLNRYIISFYDAHLEIEKGLFRRRRIPWTSVSEIHIQLMKVEMRLASGKSLAIDFSNMSFSDNQTFKPRIIDAVTAFAEAKGIPVQDGRGAGPTP